MLPQRTHLHISFWLTSQTVALHAVSLIQGGHESRRPTRLSQPFILFNFQLPYEDLISNFQSSVSSDANAIVDLQMLTTEGKSNSVRLQFECKSNCLRFSNMGNPLGSALTSVINIIKTEWVRKILTQEPQLQLVTSKKTWRVQMFAILSAIVEKMNPVCTC